MTGQVPFFKENKNSFNQNNYEPDDYIADDCDLDFTCVIIKDDTHLTYRGLLSDWSLSGDGVDYIVLSWPAQKIEQAEGSHYEYINDCHYMVLPFKDIVSISVKHIAFD